MTFKCLLKKVRLNKIRLNGVNFYLISFTFTIAILFTTGCSANTSQNTLAKTSVATSETSANSSATVSQTKAKNATKPSKAGTLDTSHWITYPVGRYLIDLPPNANFYWHPLRFRRQFDLVWVKDMSIEEANALLRKEAEIAKQTPHQTEGNSFISLLEGVGAYKQGLGLVTYAYPSSRMRFYRLYFVNMLPPKVFHSKLKNRVYYYETRIINNREYIDNGTKFIDWMSSRVALSAPSLPLGVGEGIYFDGGFFIGPSNISWPKREEIGVEVTFPEYPGVEFSIYFDHMYLDTDIKRANTTIAGNPAREELDTHKKNGINHYNFSLEAPSKEDRIDVPNIFMHLRNSPGGVMRDGKSTRKLPIKRASFHSKEDAKAVWNAIKKSVRWRPDGWIVDSPDDYYFIVGGRIVPFVYNKAPEDK